MNAAGGIHSRTGGSELSHKLLNRFNVLVVTDRRNKFHSIQLACASAVAVGASETCIAYHLPLTIITVTDSIGIVTLSPAAAFAGTTKMLLRSVMTASITADIFVILLLIAFPPFLMLVFFFCPADSQLHKYLLLLTVGE